MKLEKFKKYGKRNKKIIGSVVGIVLIICGVLLLKSFAFFESQHDFDVIKGRIPNFTAGDVTLAFTIDGVKSSDAFPNKDDGYLIKSVNCQNGTTAEWDNKVWSLIIVNSNGNKKINCNIDFTPTLYKIVNVGDLVNYIPSSTNYTIPTSSTGYSSNQTINPSELNVWRVIRKNEDGTIEMVSEYTSSTIINFYGGTGYNNLVSTLNTTAKQYETNGITSGSRCTGSDTNDLDLIKAAMPSEIGLKAKKKNTIDFSNYWLPETFVPFTDSQGYSPRRIKIILSDGEIDSVKIGGTFSDGSWYHKYTVGYNFRPIVKLAKSICSSDNLYILNN